MVDNFKKLKGLMDFSDPEKFYYLQILARSKDGHNKATKVVKNYFIQNEEYFDAHEQQIKDLCNFFTARAYLRLNRRSYEQVAFENLKQISEVLSNKQYEFVQKSFSKACGRTNSEARKVWIVDLDREDFSLNSEFHEAVDNVYKLIRELQSEINNRDYKILGQVPTPNGLHILTNPFNVKKFNDILGEDAPDLKKDNPTILYANV